MKEDRKNMIIILSLLLGLSGYIIWQKFFEPMFLIVLFLLINTKITTYFLQKEKNMVLYYLYLILYLASAALNEYFQISSKMLV